MQIVWASVRRYLIADQVWWVSCGYIFRWLLRIRCILLILEWQGQLRHKLWLRLAFALKMCLLGLFATDIRDNLVIDVLSRLTTGRNQSLRTWHSVTIKDLARWALVVPIRPSERVRLGNSTHTDELLWGLIKEGLYFMGIFPLSRVHWRTLIYFLGCLFDLAAAWPNLLWT